MDCKECLCSTCIYNEDDNCPNDNHCSNCEDVIEDCVEYSDDLDMLE